ncbi:cytochrome P450 [Thelonectria olida]|uniref:Bifunctional cytochrome P450/NADPH--P450 reductase n=1 Tax=Thelonectria olida TaxID=1576542 RepID=A0A9P8W0D2_9HYPO|nr:cytochrome P450 [Thelonectria olida]
MAETVEIPEPRGLPFIGHVGTLDPDFPLGSMISLADELGEVYRLRFPGRTVVFVSTQALVNEVCNEKRFKKSVNSALTQVREGVNDGLFTARMGEENWGIAHRVLMPAFGPLSVKGMFDEMHDISSQLALKWARYGPDSPISVSEDFTRLTLDTLALCSMGYRFNSYYSPELHPFIAAMGDFLTEAGEKPRRPPLPSFLYRTRDEKFRTDIDTLRSTAKEVLDARKAGGKSDRSDLLDAMLQSVDSKTGKKMTDESIMDNLITFLIAGHETTSGLLSFTFYQLLKHPECYQKAQQEVDDVVGKGPIQVEHLSKLPYINGVLREVLRLNATLPLFTLEAFEDTLLGGKYPVKAGETIVTVLPKSMSDPLVYGDDAREFIPERMFDDNFNRIQREFPNCWKPFGNGQRGCIGRAFAWQEALLTMVMLLQNFSFVLDPDYKLEYKQTLTIKPKDMQMRAILRGNLTATTLERRLAGMAVSETKSLKVAAHGVADESLVPLTILYGSNSGTCESLAQRIATDAAGNGFRATCIASMDSAQGKLPTDHPVVIVTSSYEGQPPDNASHFVAWLEDAEPDENPLKDVQYAVFGCGHKDWVQTFHRVPKLVDTTLEELGATRLAELGLADASTSDVFTDFEAWEDNKLWPALTARYETADASEGWAKGIDVTVSNLRTSTLRQDVREATVIDNRILARDDERGSLKKHIEIQLPKDMTYQAGDYVAVLPINPQESVHRAMRRFKVARDAQLEINTNGPLALPVNTSVPAYDILSSYVELSQPATKRNLLTMAYYVDNDQTKAALENLSEDYYADEIKAKRVSVLDVLERYPSIDLPIGVFLFMMPSMRIRQYSISSSPLVDQSRVTITFSMLNQPSFSGQGAYLGVATSYLDSLSQGDTVQVAIRPSHATFSLPAEAETAPIICIAAGSGIAPFRSFIQERAAMLESGRKLAPAILFFGCRYPDVDDLYSDELLAWQDLGAVDVRRAYSRVPKKSEGCKHVQDRMWKDREDVIELWQKGATVFVCGSRGVAESAKNAMIKIKVEMEERAGKAVDLVGTQKWFEGLRNVRYITDVFD